MKVEDFEEDFLDRAIQNAIERLQAVNQDFDQLSTVDQTLLRVQGAQGAIDNGGLQFFFESDWEGQPPYSEFVAAYRRIGAHDAARRLEQAVGMLFTFPNPHLDSKRRQACLDACDETDEVWGIDNQLCGDQKVWTHLAEYVKLHCDDNPADA